MAENASFDSSAGIFAADSDVDRVGLDPVKVPGRQLVVSHPRRRRVRARPPRSWNEHGTVRLILPVPVTESGDEIPSFQGHVEEYARCPTGPLLAFLMETGITALCPRLRISEVLHGMGPASQAPVNLQWLEGTVSPTQMDDVLWYMLASSRGGPTRVRILQAIDERPRNANELATTLELDYTTVRHHLDVLMANNILRRSGDEYAAVYLFTEQVETHWDTVEEIFATVDAEE